MNNKIKNCNSTIIITIVIVGVIIGKYLPTKIQLFSVLCLTIIFTIGFIVDFKRSEMKTPKYVYIGGILVLIFLNLYLFGRTYLGWGSDLILWGIIPVFFVIIMGLITKFRSGDEEQIDIAKKVSILLVIALIMSIFIIISIFTVK